MKLMLPGKRKKEESKDESPKEKPRLPAVRKTSSAYFNYVKQSIAIKKKMTESKNEDAEELN